MPFQNDIQKKINKVSGFNPFVYKIPLVQKMICKIMEYTLIRRTLSMTLR